MAATSLAEKCSWFTMTKVAATPGKEPTKPTVKYKIKRLVGVIFFYYIFYRGLYYSLRSTRAQATKRWRKA